MTTTQPDKKNGSSDDRYLRIRNLVKWFGDDRAVDNISFDAPKGSFLTLLGPSGCGKTTTLMSIAGLHAIDSGEIQVGDRVFTAPRNGVFLAPEKRNIGMVFQSYAIWPHMTVADNVAYPLTIRKTNRREIDDRVADVLQLVGLADMSEKLATQLSGGQQQRAALARAIVAQPDLLLFDEPLSNLDLKLREQMRVEMKRIQNEIGITSVYVTHDQSEALVMSDEIIVMSKGHIEQKGPPLQVYRSPANRYVSGFIGVANLFDAEVLETDRDGRGRIRTGAGGETLVLSCRIASGVENGDRVVLSIRPEDVHVESGTSGAETVRGEVLQTIFLGSYVDCRIRWGDVELRANIHPRQRLATGDPVQLRFDTDHILAVPL